MITYVRLDKKTVDWRINPFPEENPFDVKVQSLEADEEIQLYNYRYKAEGTPKAVIIMFHGYGSYTGKYGYYAKYFADKGYDFVGFDFRGFGKTKGQRGHIDSWEQHIKDCWTYYDIVRSNYDASIPFIGWGYSLGGGTTYWMAIERPDSFKCLIQLAPFAGLAVGKHPAYFLSKAIYKFYPRVGVSPPLRNPAPHMKHYYDDPLQVIEKSTAASIMALDTCENYIHSNINKLTINMHVTVGDGEATVSRPALQKITKEAPAEIKEYLEYPGVDHYILNNGIYMEEVIENQLEFLERNLK